jgi:hypothetical protein
VAEGRPETLTYEDDDSGIGFHLIERLPDCFPTIRCAIEVGHDGFRGRDDSAHFEEDAVNGFLADLRALEATRRGAASLPEIDYACAAGRMGSRISFRSIDSAGHIAVRVQLLNSSYLSNGDAVKKQLDVEFELDGSRFFQLVRDFVDTLGER